MTWKWLGPPGLAGLAVYGLTLGLAAYFAEAEAPAAAAAGDGGNLAWMLAYVLGLAAVALGVIVRWSWKRQDRLLEKWEALQAEQLAFERSLRTEMVAALLERQDQLETSLKEGIRDLARILRGEGVRLE